MKIGKEIANYLKKYDAKIKAGMDHWEANKRLEMSYCRGLIYLRRGEDGSLGVYERDPGSC